MLFKLFGSHFYDEPSDTPISDGFFTTSLLYCTGALLPIYFYHAITTKIYNDINDKIRQKFYMN